MSFVEIVREKAAQLAHSAVKTSGSVVEQVKSNYAIADKEVEIGKDLKELGNIMYEAYKQGGEPDADAVAEKCVELDKKYDEIKQLREKINDLKNVKVCSECKAEIRGEAKFCSGCGKQVE